MSLQNLLEQARGIFPELQQWRRTLHQHPELEFDLDWTAPYVAGELEQIGLNPRTGVGISGIVAEIGDGGPVVALRADMDALPILEENDVPYKSTFPGRMHACGHDAHTAMLLGAAKLLSQAHRERPLPGRVRLIFQPSEEAHKEGRGGARRMIEDGVLEGVQAIFGQHVDPEVTVGDVATRPGPMMAAAEAFRLAVFGRAGHAAFPHQGLDAIAIAAQVLNSLHQVVSRRLNPIKPAVITVGTINGGTKSNVLAGEVRMTGTIRTFDDETRERLVDGMNRAAGIARTLGGDYELEILPGTVPLVNDPDLFSFARSVISELLGEEHFLEAPIRMGGEDFSFFAREVPGLFLRLGVRAPDAPVRPLHTPTFDLDERALPIGAAMLSALAVRWLGVP